MKQKIIKFILILGLSNNYFLFANPLDPQNFAPPTKQELVNGANIQDLKQNNFYLGIDEDNVEKIIQRDQKVQEAFDGFTEKEINYKPVIRPIASMDTISLHPYFTFTLLLPKGSVISYIDSSVAMAVLKYENNTVLMRPNANFTISNITILYKINDENKVLNILAKKYEKLNGEKLNLLYSYDNVSKRDGMEVILSYAKVNGEYPKDAYSFINIDGVTYRIVEDEKFGKYFVNGKKYRVDNNTIHK